ncbi:sensor histidine kinase [Metabacillus malikii]|uniref:histidine kinase n=1 Tax=Metabacillus malikii TaxID=1504265 RepID=A0ABT9ZHJ0_9BACI|nr:sensor histidine kinase [Metabacillus malikii]MDQ0231763.1 two-component system sensor histidine kinase YesM [Metabacillus malikii]
MRLKRIIRRIYRWFSRLSLQNKLVFLYTTLFMIPVLLLVFVLSHEFYENVISDTIRDNEYSIEMEKIQVQKNIEAMRESAQTLISDKNMIQFVSDRRDKDVDELIEFQNNHIDTKEQQLVNPLIDYTQFYIDDPDLIEMWPLLFRESRINEKPWYDKVLEHNGTEVWWLKKEDYGLLTNIPDENPKISLFREVMDSHNNHLGIIEISMLQRNFFPKMYSPIPDGQSEIFIINQQDEVFTNPANNFLREHKFKRKQYDELFQRLTKDKTDSFIYNNHNVPYLIVSTVIDELNMKMVNVISLEKIDTETRKVRYLTFIIAIVLLIILSTLTYVITSLLLKKMYKLIENMKQVEQGDFTVKIDIDGRDEFSTLAIHFRNMLRKINQLIADAVHKQAVSKDTELRALKTQIDSHFLYNTLENIKMMAEIEGKYEISDALTSLGAMMRYNIKWKNEFVVISEEITQIKHYVAIMNLRLDRELDLDIVIPDELLSQEILKLSLQPIVENAIKHGIEPRETNTKGKIIVNAYREGQSVFVEIIDNGVGMDENQLMQINNKIVHDDNHEVQRQSGNGIGLKNVHNRIILFYGKEFGLQVNSKKGEYTSVIIKLPYLLIRGANEHV